MSKLQLSEKDVEKLSKTEASEKAEELRKEIRRHDYLYYVENEPEISDEKYDELFDSLKRLEEHFPEIATPDSPTQRVGAEPVDEFPIVEHEAPMLSLDATREEEEVRRFAERLEKAAGDGVGFLVEEKFDGASVEIVYEEGRLARAVTRGNGDEGEEITENIKTIGSVPLRLREDELQSPSLLAVRGEVLMKASAFETLNQRLLEAGKDAFANPRNAAAGSLRQLDPRITAQRPLEVIAYEILRVDGHELGRDREVLEALGSWGFPVPGKARALDDIDDVIELHREWESSRDDLDYEIDGMVIKLDQLSLREKLGATTHHPRWALAYKFAPRKEITRVERIVVQVGRTGILTPVALLRPVEVGGVTVSRASLHNREEVERKDVREGDRVRIQRAGDVIPEVVERIKQPGRKRHSPFAMPSKCPSCGARVIDDGPYTVCPNRYGCRAQLAGRIEHFASKAALDIETLGPETVQALIEREMVQELPDLFRLSSNDFEELEGFAQKSAKKLAAAIEDSKRVALRRFIYSLGIPEVGAAVARDLAEHFGSLPALRDASRDELRDVAGIGPKMAEAIREFFDDDRNQKLIDELLEVGVEPQAPEGKDESPLAGKKFVFTGSLERFSRNEAESLVESLGARATSSVSRETDYVVVGEDPGSKLDDAKDEGVERLDESAFLSLLEDAGADV